MQIYLVGGAVRDELLGRPVEERDWVVVGTTPEWMLGQGYQPVGKDFPVFLHPKTKEEYALARTERKSGKGYKGFICYAAPDVTLEEDLKRRDLTINAIAKSKTGEIIDPFHGQEDLKNKILRHVSPAFAEDPLRVLRVARFAASLNDFSIDPETLKLMQQLSESGELLTLSTERIWKELERILSMQNPARFFEVLQACHAMSVLFPEIQTLDLLKEATQVTGDSFIRLVCLLSGLSSVEIKALSKRVSIPTDYQELATLVANYYQDYQKGLSQSAEKILTLFKKTDAFRRPQRFEQFLFVCQIRSLEGDLKSGEFKKAFKIAKDTKLKAELMQTISGKEIGERLDLERKKAIEHFLNKLQKE